MFSVVQDWQLITCNGASSKLFIKTFKFIIWTIFINVSNQRPDINILISTFKCMYCIAEIDQVKLCPNYKINRRGFKYVQTSYKIIHCSLQGSCVSRFLQVLWQLRNQSHLHWTSIKIRGNGDMSLAILSFLRLYKHQWMFISFSNWIIAMQLSLFINIIFW